VNSLKFSFEMVRAEVNAIDFIAMTALQVFEPLIYSGIRDNKDLFVGGELSLHSLSESSREQAKTRINEIIRRAARLSESDTKVFLSRLFPNLDSIFSNVSFDAEYRQHGRLMGRVCHPENFETFFRLAIPEGEISRVSS
jgi:predicted KAP-like P-loop ATPase